MFVVLVRSIIFRLSYVREYLTRRAKLPGTFDLPPPESLAKETNVRYGKEDLPEDAVCADDDLEISDTYRNMTEADMKKELRGLRAE